MSHIQSQRKQVAQKNKFCFLCAVMPYFCLWVRLRDGERRETGGRGGRTDRMFWWVWTVLQIGADSNRPVQVSVQHMAYLSGTFSSRPQRPLKYLVSPCLTLHPPTHTQTHTDDLSILYDCMIDKSQRRAEKMMILFGRQVRESLNVSLSRSQWLFGCASAQQRWSR